MNEAARHIACVIEWLKRPDWGQYKYMEGSEIYTHREDALIDLNCATAAIEGAEAAAFRRGWLAGRDAAELHLRLRASKLLGSGMPRQYYERGADAIAALPPPEDEL